MRARQASAQSRGRPVPPLLRGVLWVLFSGVLVLRHVRSLRRRPIWNWLRAAALLGACALTAGTTGWWRLPGLTLALAAVLLSRTKDPDSERRIQRMHGADYLLNGGEWVGPAAPGGSAPLAPREALYLLIRNDQLLLVPRDGESAVRHAVSMEEIEQITVDGSPYVPIYVSEAKQPPVREIEVDRHAESELRLALRSGDSLRFAYCGAFHRHLAETAAHAIFSVRSAARA